MYNEIASIYHEIFPLNRAFLEFIPEYLGHLGAEVLDLGCGPGDYVHTLSQTQYNVTGIDSSAEMIRQAKSRRQGTFYPFSFTEIDKLDGPFACIYCIGNSLSYLPASAMKPFLKDVRHLLNDCGYFVLQVVNWDKFRLTGGGSFPVKTLADGRTFHRSYERTKEGTVLFQTELRKDGETQGAWADTLYPKYLADMVSAVQVSGMVSVDQFGDYDKSPFSPPSSPATILVVQKEAK